MAKANSRKDKPSREHGLLSGKGISEDVTWLMIGMVILVLTVALFYFVFPRTSCDQLAQVSSQELKVAMECAAKYPDGKDTTGKPCNVAQVKLCQENSFSIVGVGFTQAYLGMMLPEYMMYYQKFPTQPVAGLSTMSGTASVFATGLKFSESYPFERAYTGQRPWDFKPTFTQFKQFFQTRYLQKGCTDDQALCFNIRGREELVRTDLPGIDDVRLRRDGMGIAQTNPKFHLVAPCYAKVTFKKDGTNLLGTVITQDAGGSSNYCYATEGALQGLIASYTGEVSCEAGMLILDFMTLGGKKAITEGAKVGAEVAAKEVGEVVAKDIAKEVVEQTGKRVGKFTTRKEIGGIVVEETLTATEKRIGRSLTTVERAAIRDAVEEVASAKPTNAQLAKLAGAAAAKRYYRMEGMYSLAPFQDNPQKLASLFGLFIPCVDVDVCRAAFSCTEALIWPGWPFVALGPDNMKGGRSAGATSEVFFQCCDTFNYGTEKDPTKITCSEPDYLVEALRPELKLNETDPVTLDVLGKHLGWGTADIPGACSMAKGDNSKDCRETREVRAAGLPPDRCVVFPGDGVDPIYTHTYDFGTVKDVRNATVMARLATEQCDSTIKVETSNDAASWVAVASARAEQFPNETFIDVDGPLTFQYLRVSEDGGCAFDTSSVALNPTVDSVVKAEPDVTYELGREVWNYFEMPAGFSSTAKGICNSVKDCIDIGVWIPEESTWQHWSYDPKVGELGVNFQVFGGDRIGILTTEASEAVFKVGS